MFTSTHITKSDFNKICRTCLQFENRKFLKIGFEVLNMLETCTTIKIYEDDELPNNICEMCLNKINEAFCFKQQCENADRLLQQIICNLSENKEWFNQDTKENINAEDFLKTEDENLSEKANEKYETNIIYDRKNDESICTKSKDKRYSCEICYEQFNVLKDLEKHVHKHKIEPVLCTMCGKKFLIQQQLDNHIRTVHNNSNKNINCSHCGKHFQWPCKLKRHLLKHTKGNNYACTQCDKMFKDQVYLDYHNKRVHLSERNLVVCTICGKSVVRLKDHLATHTNDKPFKCTQCPKEFSSKKYLLSHEQRKHIVQDECKRRPYLCSICGKGSLTTTALKKHIELMHTDGQLHPCPICNKKFKNYQNINVHIRHTHNDERRYSCTVCPKRLSTSTKLKIHMRVHTGERPYTCKICNKSFSQMNSLNTHMKVHRIDVNNSKVE